MEELLASIRKAINEDIGEAPPTRREAFFSGSMRESRVKAANAAPSAINEIEELRSKINKNRTEGLGKAAGPAPQPNPPAKSPGFAGILGGEPEWPKRLPDYSPQPVLRSGFAEADARPHDPRKDRPQVRQPEPAFEASASYRTDPHVMSPESSAEASAAFNRLADSVLSRATGERSIEDMTRELLRGMVKQWLDENLPALVERLVREEIERVGRRGRSI